jgi:hypothetical protein
VQLKGWCCVVTVLAFYHWNTVRDINESRVSDLMVVTCKSDGTDYRKSIISTVIKFILKYVLSVTLLMNQTVF